MTVKDAIDILEGYKQRLVESCSNQLDTDIKAFDLAIKALNGAIICMSEVEMKPYFEGYKAGREDFEPHKGEWIDGDCSICGCPCKCDCWGNDIETKFCSNCGARMKRSNEE